MSAASEQARSFAAAWRENPLNGDTIYSLMRMQGPKDAREVVEEEVTATLLDQLADEVEKAEAASRVGALNRAFGSRTGDSPRFTAEAEGDDYLFGPAPRAVRPTKCGNTIGIRYPDAPVDQWESATCIQQHDSSPGAERTIHDSGDGWKWMLLDGFKEVAPLVIPSADLKALREALCRAQGGRLTPEDSDRLSEIVTEIDRHRPLGPDGKHGELHTPTCGCEDR